MIKVFTNPWLGDFMQICARMPQDERDQLEAYTGCPYSIDGAAIGNFTVEGPKWVIKDDDVPLVVGGFSLERPGVWRDYLLTTPEAWDKKYWFHVTRVCRKAMDAMFDSKQAHRIETVVPEERVLKRPELIRWYRVMGYTKEAVHNGYMANGGNALRFARVQHG